MDSENESGSSSELSRRQRVTVAICAVMGGILFVAPAVFMVLWDVGPGHWVISIQDSMFGKHVVGASIVILTTLEIMSAALLVALVGVLVRFLAGRPLGELFRKRPR